MLLAGGEMESAGRYDERKEIKAMVVWNRRWSW